MEWTKDMPTVPGLYAVQTAKGVEAAVLVRQNDGERDSFAWRYFASQGANMDYKRYDALAYCGPLVLPAWPSVEAVTEATCASTNESLN